ncbi:hypothetical protein KFL_003830085 [Klebsormidium nitens]|uniref:Dynamin-type G domain-containing protein n=1 Tax=Klebsormidium nitens TaxID=105231 RepID=A0A1Y1IEK3_KLENI|nr:hypothetical protein KFL_003830085 [Klebsormidium nitens]|eukprot:GAQ87859.1 hypothetical protein KFL_003830085 [Klebsormidium nitens]
MALTQVYEKTMRPLLDTIDTLRKIGVADEGIKLPTIVVIGDQSSGKSSVIERLSGVSLPRGKGIVTRVPLVMRIKSSESTEELDILIEYGSEKKNIMHEEVEEAVREATRILAGDEKGVCPKPINLSVCGPDLPDLTLVDLPGITRVPIKGQPQDIYQQVVNMIREQIKPEETVILNVISAEVDWATCESFNLSKEVDQEGSRTLAVVTKVDREPDGAYEKVLANDVNVGLGYVLNKLTEKQSALQRLPPSVVTEAEAMMEFLRITSERTRIMEGLMLRGDRHVEFYDDEEMLYPSKLNSLFEDLEETLRGATSKFFSEGFRNRVKTATVGFAVANFLSHSVFKQLLHEEVEKCKPVCFEVLEKVVEYTLRVSDEVIDICAASLPGLATTMKETAGQRLGASQQTAYKFIERELEKSQAIVCTFNHYYMDTVSSLTKGLDECKDLQCAHGHDARNWPTSYNGTVRCGHGHAIQLPASLEDAPEGFLKAPLVDNASQALQVMQISVYAYWKVIHKILIDIIPKELRF